MYISRVLKPAGIKVTRLARGLAVGSDIEYADEVTLLRAIENRTELISKRCWSGQHFLFVVNRFLIKNLVK